MRFFCEWCDSVWCARMSRHSNNYRCYLRRTISFRQRPWTATSNGVQSGAGHNIPAYTNVNKDREWRVFGNKLIPHYDFGWTCIKGGTPVIKYVYNIILYASDRRGGDILMVEWRRGKHNMCFSCMPWALKTVFGRWDDNCSSQRRLILKSQLRVWRTDVCR